MSMNRREILRLIGLGAPALAAVPSGRLYLDNALFAKHKREQEDMIAKYSRLMEYYTEREHMDEEVPPEVYDLDDAITRKRGYVQTMEAGA